MLLVYLIAIDKPAGLLSVPGRTIDLQDSVLTRLRASYPEIYAVHRLDRDTSGILLLARDKLTYRHLSQQFEARQIHKVYEAILGGRIETKQGSIELPLWGDTLDRPRQKVDFNLGKPSLTKFQVSGQIEGTRGLSFFQLRGGRINYASMQPILAVWVYVFWAIDSTVVKQMSNVYIFTPEKSVLDIHTHSNKFRSQASAHFEYRI